MNQFSPLSISTVWFFCQLPFLFFGLFGGVEACNSGCKQYTNILSIVEKAEAYNTITVHLKDLFPSTFTAAFFCCVPPLGTDVESCVSRKKKQHTRLLFSKGTIFILNQLLWEAGETVYRYSTGLAIIHSNRLTVMVYFTRFLLFVASGGGFVVLVCTAVPYWVWNLLFLGYI